MKICILDGRTLLHGKRNTTNAETGGYKGGIFMRKIIHEIIVIIAITLIGIFSLMLIEYRYIMNNIRPYTGNNETVYIEMFGQIDEYYASPIAEITME